jgi:FtsP/CotA-like multicopper oxidase with cupredoxin domain
LKQRHHPRLSSPTRREVLGLIALGAAAVAVGGCDDLAPLSPVRSLGFKQRLWIPPEVRPQVDASGGWVFNLTARTGQPELIPGKATQTWGINGDYLGPTLRAPRGQQITINLRNLLPETTTMHWHGAHLPPAADGGPHQPIDPGATWSPTWRINQPAATLWYHPHPHGHSEMHVYRGLAGMFIIDDEEEAALPLPRTYGVDDIPVIIQDKRFGPDGQLDGSDHSPVGLLGDTILVNGTAGPISMRQRS